MSFNFKWYSHSGSITDDNRDFCGVKLNQEYNLYIIVDGTTCSPNSGEFAREIVKKILKIDTTPLTQNSLSQNLKQIHTKLRFKYITDSASFLLVIQYPNGRLITYHSGDCLVGKHSNGSQIEWLISPHTLANAITSKRTHDLANDPLRHQLTRSFRARRFIEPEFNTIQLSPSDQFLLASDGFWAELSTEAQADLIQKGTTPTKSLDDISYLSLNIPINNRIAPENNIDNLIVFKPQKPGKEMGKNSRNHKDLIPLNSAV